MKFSWGDCELDREACALTRAGQLVPTQPLVMDLLLLLLAHRGRVLSEEVLRREVWHGVHVSDASLRRLLKEARRAVGDDGERKEQIQTVRGRGVRFAAPVTTQGGWDTSLVGRADLLESLEHKLEEVVSGIGGVTLLHGPAGIGKTRVLTELGARAEARNLRVLHGCGRSGAEGDAFHPWLDAASEIRIDELLRAGPDPHPANGRVSPSAEAQRFELFRAVTRKLTSYAREQATLIALDDLQLADHDSLALLRFIAPALARSRIWILGCYRTGGSRVAEERVRELAEIGAETSTQSIELRGLTAVELRAVVQNDLRVEVGSELATLLASRTEGNPLFSLEIARWLQQLRGSLDVDLTAEVEAGLARGIGPLLARRLAALSPPTRRLMTAAAALGTEFNVSLLRAVEGCSARAVDRAVDEGAAAGLLAQASAETWRFAHPLFAEALCSELESLGGDAVAAQHLRIAEACERSGVEDPFLLAGHFVRARPLARGDRVLSHVRTAASVAWRRSAFADAEFWYRVAIALAEDTAAPSDELIDLLLSLGDVLVAGTGVTQARVVFERAARIAERNLDFGHLSLAALGYAHRPAGQGEADSNVVMWLRAAHAAPSGDPALQASVSSRLGAELAGSPDQAVEADARMREGVAAARALGDSFTLGRVLGDLNSSQFSAPDTRAWIALAEEVARHGHDAGDDETEFRGLQARATGYLELGERDALEDAVAQCRRFASSHPFRFARTVTKGMDAMLALLDGRLADAREAIDQAERESGTTSVGLAAQIAAQRFWLAFEAGNLGELQASLNRAWVRFPSLPALSAAAGLAHALSGETAEARRALAAVIERLPVLARDRSRLPTLVLAAELAYRVRSTDAATAIELELRPHAALGAVIATASAYAGSVSQGLGWAEAARGNVNEAVSHFQNALRTHENLRGSTWCRRSESAIVEVTGASARRSLHLVDRRS